MTQAERIYYCVACTPKRQNPITNLTDDIVYMSFKVEKYTPLKNDTWEQEATEKRNDICPSQESRKTFKEREREREREREK